MPAKKNKPTPKPEGEPGIRPEWSVRLGKWTFTAIASVDGKQKWVRGFATKPLARAARDEMRVGMRKGLIGNAPARLTLGELILQQWLPAQLPNLEPGSRREYTRIAKRIARHSDADHGDPADLGSMRLVKLTSLNVEDWKRSLAASGLNGTSCASYYRFLKSILRWAVQHDLIYRNVCDQVKAPRRAKHEPPVMDIDTIKHLLREAETTPYGLFVYLAAAEGLRFGEMAQLTWRNVDVADATVRVPKAKTPSGVRPVKLGPVALARLQQHRLEQMARYTALDTPPPQQVFLREDGQPITASWFWLNVWVGIRLRAGLPELHFHDLRHVHATLLARAKVSPKVAQDRLGHSDAALTLNIYQHTDAGQQIEAAAAVEALLAEADVANS